MLYRPDMNLESILDEIKSNNEIKNAYSKWGEHDNYYQADISLEDESDKAGQTKSFQEIKKHYEKIQRGLGITDEQLKEVINQIIKLNPKPGGNIGAVNKAETYVIPDFFIFNDSNKLVYRGQLDDSRPGNNIPINGNDLVNAIECLINKVENKRIQKPSIGCNIKWKVN